MAKKNSGFEVVSLTGKPIDSLKLKARKLFNTPMRVIHNIQAVASGLTTHFMVKAPPKGRKKIQRLATKLLGNADSYFSYQTYTDDLLKSAMLSGNKPLIIELLSENNNEMSHKGLVYNIESMAHIDNTLQIIPKAIDAFMAKKDGIEDDFVELPDLLLCQNKINNRDGTPKSEHKQISLDFIEKYSSEFTHKMLMDFLTETIKKYEPDCFDKLIELSPIKLTAEDKETLQTLKDDIAEKARQRQAMYKKQAESMKR